MSTGALLQFVGWISLPMLAILAGILIWRRIPRSLPYFFDYILGAELIGIARLWAYHVHPRTYVYTYWISDVLIAIFAFLATFELFVRRLFPRFYRVRFYQYLFPAAAVVISALAVPAALQSHKLSTLLMVIHTFGVLRVGLLIFFVGLMLFMGRQWTRWEFGVALGLGVEASGWLAASAIWTRAPAVRHVLDQLPVISYDIACLVWLITFLKPEKTQPAPTPPISGEMIREAKQWEQTLKDSLAGKKGSE